MLILLSPSKTLRPAPPSTSELIDEMTTAMGLREAVDIMASLKAWTESEVRHRMKLSDNLASRVQDWHQSWSATSPFAAASTFQGDAFKSLDFGSLPTPTAREAQRRLRIIHGVYGLLRPLDEYAPVRLEMGQPWCHSSAHKTMAAFWKHRLPALLDLALAESKESLILNLASREYSDVALHGRHPSSVITCSFLENKKGDLKSISSFSKTARGAMARFVLIHGISEASELQNFAELGYEWDASRSSSNEKVFVRT